MSNFVNRHGHKVSVDDAVVEASPVSESTLPEQPAAVKPQKVKTVRNKKPAKKIILIFFALLLGFLLVPVIGGELVRARYISSRDGARAQLIEYATKTVVPQQKKQVTPSQLADAADRVEKIRDDACDGGFTDNLASIYPRAKVAFNECIVLKRKIDAIAVNLRDMESQVRYLDALTPVVDPVSRGTAEEFAIISAQHENWRAVDGALAKLSPAASQRATHEQLKLQSKVIVDAWSALNTANNNQDAAAFAEAEKKLGAAYEAFRTSSAVLSKILNDTQTALTTNYKAL